MWKLEQKTQPSSPVFLEEARRGLQLLRARNDLGFLRLTEGPHWTPCAARAREMRAQTSRLVVLGIGGSSLGGRALLHACRYTPSVMKASTQIEFVENVDPHEFWNWIQTHPHLQEVHWLLISKSGNTIETLTTANFIDQYLREKGLGKLSSRATVICEDTDNALAKWARAEGVPILPVPLDVGGRFSVLSAVGCVPAAFSGVNIERMRDGARWALAQDELIIEIVAQTLESFAREEWVTLFWPYAEGLRDMAFWWRQLWAESLSKAKDRKNQIGPRVSTPMPCMGSVDQHSILQQVMEGPRDKFIWFLRVDESEQAGPKIAQPLFGGASLPKDRTMGDLMRALAEATQQATASQGIPSLSLRTSQLNEETIAELFMLLQMVVGTLGECLDIDAFNQPGVELGKRLARGML